jgi:hypothetical protein
MYEREALSVDKALRQNIVQAALFDHLQSIHGDNASGEQDFGMERGSMSLSAIGTTTSTSNSRQACPPGAAFGTLSVSSWNISYWPGAQQAHMLVIVSEAEYDDEAKTYIERLRKDFLLPIEYRRFDMNLRRLV